MGGRARTDEKIKGGSGWDPPLRRAGLVSVVVWWWWGSDVPGREGIYRAGGKYSRRGRVREVKWIVRDGGKRREEGAWAAWAGDQQGFTNVPYGKEEQREHLSSERGSRLTNRSSGAAAVRKTQRLCSIFLNLAFTAAKCA